MMSRTRITTALCLLAAGLPATAAAAPSRVTWTIQGTVSTICRLDFDRPVATEPNGGIVELGSYSELCNDRDGYRIVMQHPAGLQNASV